MTLDYFYGQAGKLFSFYRIPKALFQEQRFQNLSTDAKTLYGILLDRMSLSVKNEWFDKQGRVFIIFTIEDVKRALCCADNKATKLLRELENFGLIERKRRGLGKPSLVYVKNFSSDLSNERVQNRENHESGSPKNACQDPPKSRCNKNKKSKTERNNTNPILSDELEKMKNRKLLEEYFSRSLEIELLLRLYPDDEDTMPHCGDCAGTLLDRNGRSIYEYFQRKEVPDMNEKITAHPQKEEREKVLKEIRQLENRKKILENKQRNEERRGRTRRLIERGAVLEGIFPLAPDLSGAEVKTFLIALSHLPGAAELTANLPKSGDTP